MNKEKFNFFVTAILTCILVVISGYILITGNHRFLKMYLALLGVVWVLTLGIWPWWHRKNRKSAQLRRIKQNLAEKHDASEVRVIGNMLKPFIDLGGIESPDHKPYLVDIRIKEDPGAEEKPYQVD